MEKEPLVPCDGQKRCCHELSETTMTRSCKTSRTPGGGGCADDVAETRHVATRDLFVSPSHALQPESDICCTNFHKLRIIVLISNLEAPVCRTVLPSNLQVARILSCTIKEHRKCSVQIILYFVCESENRHIHCSCVQDVRILAQFFGSIKSEKGTYILVRVGRWMYRQVHERARQVSSKCVVGPFSVLIFVVHCGPLVVFVNWNTSLDLSCTGG